MPGRTPEGDALTALVLPVFALNGELLEAAAVITAPHELTPARWQVLGAVLEEPLPVAEIARRVGLTGRVCNGWPMTSSPRDGRTGNPILEGTVRTCSS